MQLLRQFWHVGCPVTRLPEISAFEIFTDTYIVEDACLNCPRVTRCGTEVPSAVSSGYLWVWTGDVRPTTTVPEIPFFHDWSWLQGTNLVDCDYMRALEITIDESHVPFAHPNHPSTRAYHSGLRFVAQVELNGTEDGFAVLSTYPRAERYAYSSRKLTRFRLPYWIENTAPSPPSVFSFALHTFIVPLSEGRTRMEWLIKAGSGNHALKWIGSCAVADEDKFLLEKQGGAFSGLAETHVPADLPALTMRRAISARGNGLPCLIKPRKFKMTVPFVDV